MKKRRKEIEMSKRNSKLLKQGSIKPGSAFRKLPDFKHKGVLEPICLPGAIDFSRAGNDEGKVHIEPADL
uniref:Uncharacterized protein n=1 Tax=Steinernema glaseri TaxID=37863 RepID=A0A1I8A4Y5_9BILA